MSDKPELQMILVKDAAGEFHLWACRGAGKGCARNRYRERKTPCDDCVLAREDETIGALAARLAKGDA